MSVSLSSFGSSARGGSRPGLPSATLLAARPATGAAPSAALLPPRLAPPGSPTAPHLSLMFLLLATFCLCTLVSAVLSICYIRLTTLLSFPSAQRPGGPWRVTAHEDKATPRAHADLTLRITGNSERGAVITCNYSCNYSPVITGANYR